MSTPEDHINFQYAELNRLNDALGTLRRLGISELDPTYRVLYQARGAALGKLGKLQPRVSPLLKLLAGLSPGQIRLFLDAELGWLVESTEKPGAQPVRKYVSEEIAKKLLKGELTPELELDLMTPVPEFIA